LFSSRKQNRRLRINNNSRAGMGMDKVLGLRLVLLLDQVKVRLLKDKDRDRRREDLADLQVSSKYRIEMLGLFKDKVKVKPKGRYKGINLYVIDQPTLRIYLMM
jgi:hypothetical protein